jgi:hypothetical protein
MASSVSFSLTKTGFHSKLIQQILLILHRNSSYLEKSAIVNSRFFVAATGIVHENLLYKAKYSRHLP